MTQHITQEDVRAVGGMLHRDGNIFFINLEVLNKAVQHAIARPFSYAVTGDIKDFTAPRAPTTLPIAEAAAMQNLNAAWLNHLLMVARVKALEEAKQVILSFPAGWVPDGFAECAAAIERLKKGVGNDHNPPT